MKHHFTEQQLSDAYKTALKEGTGGDTAADYIRAVVNHLPEPVSDEWQECEFAEVKNTDEAALFVFHDGAKIQGKPYLRSADQIYIWVGNVSFHISKLDTTKGKALIYRIPAPVRHPDPAEHPYVFDDEGDLWAWSENRQVYVEPNTGVTGPADGFLEGWTPADVVPKVVEDDR